MKRLLKGVLGAIAILTFSSSDEAFCQISIQTPNVFANDHNTVQLHWNAETGAVYQIESADVLGSPGPQGLNWVVRETDCGSKGTNAEWMDVGDSRWIPRIFHPAMQPQRFYRVAKVNQATNTPPLVSLTLSATNGITDRFIAYVSVSLADTNQYVDSVGLFIDGQRYLTTELTNFGVYINSTEWPNGSHEVYAIAETLNPGDNGETTLDSDSTIITNEPSLGLGVSSSRFCTFSNYISQFFVATPFFEAGQTQQVLASFAADSYWQVTVVDYTDTPVWSTNGQGSSCYAAWDGNDQSGNPLPYGYYDYIIDARPSEYGPLSMMSRTQSRRMQSLSVVGPEVIEPSDRYKRVSAALQFDRSLSDIHENLTIPSLAPVPPSEPGTNSGSPSFPTSAEEAVAAGLSSYFVVPPPMPPVFTNDQWVPWEEVYGGPAIQEIQVTDEEQEYYSQAESRSSSRSFSSSAASWPDDDYEARTPIRIDNTLFFGFAGTVGIGYQGHHPKKPPTFGNAPGGVLASTPPWGRLKTASTLANNFSANMGSSGWRTSFLKGDDNLNSLDLTPAGGPGTGTGTFATQCRFGFVVGHMSASVNNDPSYFATVPYVPIYNTAQPGAYQWIAMPQMDFGKASGSVNSKLKWMAFYGCQSLKSRDYTDLWTKFLLPMPPNLRMILGSEDGVFIVPGFGSRFADNMNGLNSVGGAPMTIFDAWCDAAGDADTKMSHQGWYKLGYPIGSRHMTCIYRDNTQGGSSRTISDTIWNWGADISYDWFDVSFTSRQVY